MLLGLLIENPTGRLVRRRMAMGRTSKVGWSIFKTAPTWGHRLPEPFGLSFIVQYFATELGLSRAPARAMPDVVSPVKAAENI